MTLNEWIRARSLSFATAARMLGLCNSRAVWRYAKGGAIPRPALMTMIYRATAGEVTPNDFYGLHVHAPLKKAINAGVNEEPQALQIVNSRAAA